MLHLPQELENIITEMAFDYDIGNITEYSTKDQNFLDNFINENSDFLINKIDWYLLFKTLIIEWEYVGDLSSPLRQNIIHLLENLYNENIKFKKGEYELLFVIGKPGDCFYEYLLETDKTINALIKNIYFKFYINSL